MHAFYGLSCEDTAKVLAPAVARTAEHWLGRPGRRIVCEGRTSAWQAGTSKTSAHVLAHARQSRSCATSDVLA